MTTFGTFGNQQIQQACPAYTVCGQPCGVEKVGGLDVISYSSSIFAFFTQLLPSLFLCTAKSDTMNTLAETVQQCAFYPI